MRVLGEWNIKKHDDCNFTNNTASGSGGAVFFNGNVNITNCNLKFTKKRIKIRLQARLLQQAQYVLQLLPHNKWMQ